MQFHDAYTPLFFRALEQANTSHRSQQRDNGLSYLEEHIYPVTLEVAQHERRARRPVTDRLLAKGLLHDAVEDDPRFTLRHCYDQFGDEVSFDVATLTKPESDRFPGVTERERKEYRDEVYLATLRAGSLHVRIVKLADRRNNNLCLEGHPDLHKTRKYVIEGETHYLSLAQENSPWFFERIRDQLQFLRHKYLRD